MDLLADSIAKLSQGRKNWYISREGIPVEDRRLCEPVIVFECMDLSIGQRGNVSELSCVLNKVLRCWDSYKVICDHMGRQFRSFNIAVTMEVYL